MSVGISGARGQEVPKSLGKIAELTSSIKEGRAMEGSPGKGLRGCLVTYQMEETEAQGERETEEVSVF